MNVGKVKTHTHTGAFDWAPYLYAMNKKELDTLANTIRTAKERKAIKDNREAAKILRVIGKQLKRDEMSKIPSDTRKRPTRSERIK